MNTSMMKLFHNQTKKVSQPNFRFDTRQLSNVPPFGSVKRPRSSGENKTTNSLGKQTKFTLSPSLIACMIIYDLLLSGAISKVDFMVLS